MQISPSRVLQPLGSRSELNNFANFDFDNMLQAYVEFCQLLAAKKAEVVALVAMTSALTAGSYGAVAVASDVRRCHLGSYFRCEAIPILNFGKKFVNVN